MLSHSIVTITGIDQDALIAASQPQVGDGPSSVTDRVIAIFNNGSQAFRDSVVRLGDRTTALETAVVELQQGGTRFQPGLGAQILNVGAGTATTVGVVLAVEHRSGRAYVGGRWNGGAGGQSGIPATVFSSVTELYAGYRVADMFALQGGAFHALAGRMDECASATEPCGIMLHGGGGEVGFAFGGQGMGPINVDANFLFGYGTARGHDATGYVSSTGALLGGNLRVTLRFQ
jgi:hypothetical protein